jgi:hypothetical protein
MSKVKIVTVATESKYYLPYLQETIKQNNNDLVILGYGEKWQGFSWKYKLMIDYFKTLKYNDIVCFVDGYDVICTRNLNELPNAFLKMKKEHNCKIIVGFERHTNTIFKYVAGIYFGQCKNMPLNSGTYIGYSKDLLEIIISMYNLNDPLKDDQVLMNEYCIKNPNTIYIDKKSELFLTICNTYSNIELNNELIIKNKKVFFNNYEPFFIHGFGNSYMDNILVSLGYTNLNVSNDIKNGYYSNLKYKIYSFIYNNYFYILIIFLFFIFYIIYIKIYNKKKGKARNKKNI